MQIHMNAGTGNSRQIVELLDKIKTHIESEQDWDKGNWETTKSVLDSIISDAEKQFTDADGLVGTLASQIDSEKAELGTAEGEVDSSSAALSTLNDEIYNQE